MYVMLLFVPPNAQNLFRREFYQQGNSSAILWRVKLEIALLKDNRIICTDPSVNLQTKKKFKLFSLINSCIKNLRENTEKSAKKLFKISDKTSALIDPGIHRSSTTGPSGIRITVLCGSEGRYMYIPIFQVDEECRIAKKRQISGCRMAGKGEFPLDCVISESNESFAIRQIALCGVKSVE